MIRILNIKYNFYIQPIKNNDKITIDGDGSLQKYLMNKTLDFYTNNQISFDILMENPNSTNYIRLNPNASDDLTCEDIGKSVKRCLLPRNHLDNKSGYHCIYHLNHKNKYIKFYEHSPIQVIIPIIITIKDIGEKIPINIGQKGIISLITEFVDYENIFNILDIESSTLIKMPFYGKNKTYIADCHLWKPIGDDLRLICKFNDNIEDQRLELNDTITFNYKEYIIKIFANYDFLINQLNTSISFLYSDKQEINISDTTNEYNLVFKKEVYYKENLILYKEGNDMQNIFLNCVEETK